MKKIFLALSIVAVSFAAKAQSNEGFHVAGGLHLGLPIGSFGDTHNFGIGAELQGELGLADALTGTFTTGYTSFMGKSVDLGGGFGTYKVPAVGYIPILAGVRFYAAPEFFIGAKLGYGLFTGSGSSSGGFNYRPEIGFNSEKFQLALGYNGVSVTGGTLAHLGLSALYKFN